MSCGNLNSTQNIIASIDGGGGVSFGLEGELPFVNSSSDDFEYDIDLVYKGGNLGVGMINPLAKLDIQSNGSTAATFGLRVLNSSGTSNMLLRDNGDFFADKRYAYLGSRVYSGGVQFVEELGLQLTFASTAAPIVNYNGGGVNISLNQNFQRTSIGGPIPITSLSSTGLGIGNVFFPQARLHVEGKVRFQNLPTSTVGLSAGDIYADTAANIAANGDKILGIKV